MDPLQRRIPSVDIVNPFRFQTPASPDALFVGRDDLLKYVADRLRPANCRLILLQGPRRSGKTAILRQLQQRLPEPFIPVYLDLNGRATQPLPLLMRDLAADVLTHVGYTPPARRRLEDVGQARRQLLHALQAIPPFKRLVLLLDEFDVPRDPLTADASARRLFRYIQELSGLSERVSFVIAQGRMQGMDPSIARLPLFETAPVKRVTLLSNTAARQMLESLCTSYSGLHEQAIQSILDLTGRNPFLLQLMGNLLFDLRAGLLKDPSQEDASHATQSGLETTSTDGTAESDPSTSAGGNRSDRPGKAHRREHRPSLSPLEVMACVPHALELGAEGLEWIWQGLTTTEQQVMSALAVSAPGDRPVSAQELGNFLQGYALNDARLQLDEILRSLEESEYIRRDAPGRYAVQSELWRRYIAEAYPLTLGRSARTRPTAFALGYAGGYSDATSDAAESVQAAAESAARATDAASPVLTAPAAPATPAAAAPAAPAGAPTPLADGPAIAPPRAAPVALISSAVGALPRNGLPSAAAAKPRLRPLTLAPQRQVVDMHPIAPAVVPMPPEPVAAVAPTSSAIQFSRASVASTTAPAPGAAPSAPVSPAPGTSATQAPVSKDISSPDSRFAQAEQALNEGDFAAARAGFEAVLDAEPDRQDAALGLAHALLETRAFAEAVAVLTPRAQNARCREALGDAYLHWLDSIDQDEVQWPQVAEAAIQALPEHELLRRRQQVVRVLRIKRLLSENRPIEAAAALGALGPEHQQALPELIEPLIDALESLTRANHPDAEALFHLLRSVLPEPRIAWQHYLTPMLEEAERLERMDRQRAEELYQRAERTFRTSGAAVQSVPTALRDRLQDSLKRLETQRQREDDQQLARLMMDGDLEHAEAWLEEALSQRRSPVLEEQLRALRGQRTRLTRYNAAIEHCRNQQWSQAQVLLSQVIGESPEFVGPDGFSALEVLDEVTRTKLGVGAAAPAPVAPGHRRVKALMLGAFVVGALLTLVSMQLIPPNGTQPSLPESSGSQSEVLRDGMALPALQTTSVPAAPVGSVAVVPSAPAAPAAFPEASAPSVPVTTAPAGAAVPAEGSGSSPPLSTIAQVTHPAPAPLVSGSAGPARETVRSPVAGQRPTGAIGDPQVAAEEAHKLKVRLEGERTALAPVPNPVPTLQPAPAKPAPAAVSPTSPKSVQRTFPKKLVPTVEAPPAPTATSPVESAAKKPPVEEAPLAVAGSSLQRTAQEAFRAGRLDEAFQLYRQAIAQDSRNATLWTELGDLYMKQGRSLDALRAYQKAIGLDKGQSRAWFAIGKLHQTQGHKEDALQAFQRVQALAPGSAMAQDAQNRIQQLSKVVVTEDAWSESGSQQGPVKLFEGQKPEAGSPSTPK